MAERKMIVMEFYKRRTIPENGALPEHLRNELEFRRSFLHEELGEVLLAFRAQPGELGCEVGCVTLKEGQIAKKVYVRAASFGDAWLLLNDQLGADMRKAYAESHGLKLKGQESK